MVPEREFPPAPGLACRIRSIPILEAAHEFQFDSHPRHPAPVRSRPGGGIVLMLLIIILIVLALGSGGWGYSRYGWAGMSPAGVILLFLAILYFTGNLHLN